jgi:hypothetical protein
MVDLQNPEVGAELARSTSKRDIEALAVQVVEQQMGEGYTKAPEALVIAARLQTYLAARVKALRPHALNELSGQKAQGVLGSTVERGTEAGRWAFNDPYFFALENELEEVKAKMKKKEEKDRYHITLSGECVTLNHGHYTAGGETVKVKL